MILYFFLVTVAIAVVAWVGAGVRHYYKQNHLTQRRHLQENIDRLDPPYGPYKRRLEEVLLWGGRNPPRD